MRQRDKSKNKTLGSFEPRVLLNFLGFFLFVVLNVQIQDRDVSKRRQDETNVFVVRLHQHVENAVVDTGEREHCKRAAPEQLFPLFHKADPVAHDHGADGVHERGRKTAADRPADGDVLHILNEHHHVLEHSETDAGRKRDRHHAVAVVREHHRVKQNGQGFDDLFGDGRDGGRHIQGVIV